MVTKGSLKLWNGDKCRIMGPGDFAYVPPKVIHNPEMLGPHTELNGLVAPGDWIDFFRFVAESYDGVLVPENDNRNLGALLGQKMATAKDRFDVHFERNYQPPALGDWLETENVLPSPGEPYFLRANTGPRWMLGGVMSRPFLHASQCGGKFAVSSIESSKVYEAAPLRQWLTFATVDHCFCVLEGVLRV
ncbi:Quercetin 2 like protein [Verticillium longisporum]|uniref:Quercetin 2 like protein n=1 Tax=Verticillium longisporum TaxID=100787 RepID=A0A8I2ZVG6_VERLO|nr:Quercetin 2 like protein [Verticillium longisporum]